MEGDIRLAHRIPTRLSAAEGRKFAFTVGIAFLVLAGISYWRGHTRVPVVLGSLGGVLLAREQPEHARLDRAEHLARFALD